MNDLFRKCRDDFPALRRTYQGRPLAFFDGPAGTQVPEKVIEAVSGYYATSNANTEGQFPTSRETDEMLRGARAALAEFLGAPGPETISLGANMTTLCYSLAHAIGRILEAGDEIVITQLDHEANRGPWLDLEARGVVVREVRMTPEGRLDAGDFQSKISSRTRLVALGGASNALGTVNDLKSAREWSRQAGAWLLVDAVHYAPHFPIDVARMDPDFLLCSVYKFYGPHVGVLYTRRGLLEQLPTDRLRPQKAGAPERIETGTLNHAAIAGARAAVEYLASLGDGNSFRERIVSAMTRIQDHEHHLAHRFHEGLQQIRSVRLYGPPFGQDPRAPTLSFRVKGETPQQTARRLARQGLLVWDGDFYAVRPLEVLGLADTGGLVRVGMSLYNTQEEVDRLLDALPAL